MKTILQLPVLWVCRQAWIPLRIRLVFLCELPFGLSPVQKIVLTPEQKQGAIDYVKSHPDLYRAASNDPK